MTAEPTDPGRPDPDALPRLSVPLSVDVDVVFHGFPEDAGPALIAVETTGGDTLGLLEHHVKHSPNGFQWGYMGSGPAETARCLLLAALPDPRCPSCNGTRKTMVRADDPERERPFDPVYDDPASELVLRCMDCADGLAALPYQLFKEQYVARWDGEWRLSRSDIMAWLDQHQGNRS